MHFLQRLSRSRLLFLLLITISPGLMMHGSSGGRIWTATDGRTLEATLQLADTESVTLIRSNDGIEFVLPRRRLSEQDQAYIDGWIDGRASAKTVAPERPSLAETTAALFFAQPQARVETLPPPSPSSRQALLEGYLASIQGLDYDYRKVGSVLEALAFRHLERLYPPPRYSVYRSVEYLNAAGRTVGEIDLLLYDHEAHAVIEIFECKISGQPERALRQAQDQLARFRNSLQAREVSRFNSRTRTPSRGWSLADFPQPPKEGFIGGQGTRRFGYTIELDLTREEADILQARLLASTGRAP